MSLQSAILKLARNYELHRISLEHDPYSGELVSSHAVGDAELDLYRDNVGNYIIVLDEQYVGVSFFDFGFYDLESIAISDVADLCAELRSSVFFGKL